MDFKTLLVLACVAAGSYAGPLYGSNCARQCESTENGIFEPSKTYYYDYDVTVDSRIDGGISEQSSQFAVRATAAIEALSRCEMVLKLTGVSLTELRQDGSMGNPQTADAFSSALEANQLRFAMESNGRITSVCDDQNDSPRVLNFKRGLLSAIQGSRKVEAGVGFADVGVMETDVTGTCETNYQSEGDRVVVKTKNFYKCKNRTSLNMFVDAIQVHEFAPTSSPLESELECRAQMDDSGLSSVTCTEMHTLRPFAQSESKPVTVVTSTFRRSRIMFITVSSLSDPFARQTDLIYEEGSSHSMATSTDVLDTVTQICDSLIHGVGTETPSLFEQLTQQLGQLDVDNMNTVVHKLFRICPENSASIRKDVTNMVKDALIDCDSEECADGFKTIINTENSAENDFYRQKWFMKLVLHKNPTKSMILNVKRQIEGDTNMNVHAYYALSSMIHHYCLNSETDCTRDDDIMDAASIFEMNLGQDCQPENEEEKKKMLMSLRAIGNMGVISDKALIYRCNRDRNAFKLRIASIEAFRRMPCDRVPTDRFLRNFRDTENDAELRIAAYRAIMRCPTQELLRDINITMVTEPTQQVSCYVASHLANLRASQNPLLREIQALINESPLVNVTECNMDIRKFSHNYGFSRYDAEYGNGINIDSDLIFSAKSYLPRSFRLDTTVDIFGYSLDLFEFGARMEGMQEALETTMADTASEKLNSLMSRVRHIQKKSQRFRREGVKSASINKIKTKYTQNHITPEDSQEAAISMRIFNNDIFYKDQEDFRALAAKFQPEQIMMIIASLREMRSHEYSLNKNFKPSTARIPTIAGMPLEVSIQGGMTSTLKASGKLDVLGMATKPRNMDLSGSVEPSVAVEVHSSMMVDAHCVRSGLTHKTNMASSFSIGGSIFFEHGMLKVKVNAPSRRQTLINASSSLYFMQSEDLVPVMEPAESIISVNEKLNNSQYQLNITGRRPNMQMSLPESLYRTWQVSISLDKLDETLTTYNLEGGYQLKKDYLNGQVWMIDQVHAMVGTPDTEIPATYLMDLAFHRPNNTLGIHVLTPWSDSYFTGSLRNETTHKNIHLQLAHDGEDYDLQVGLDAIPQESGTKFYPVFNLDIPNIEHYRLSGFVSNETNYNEIDLSLLNSNDQKLVAVKGDVIRNETMKRLAVTASLCSLSVSVEGGYKLNITSDTTMFTPIFSVSSLPLIGSLSLDSTPIIINSTGVTLENIRLSTSSIRLIEVSRLRFDNTTSLGLEFQGTIHESIPFGMDFNFTESRDEANSITYNVDLNVTSSFGTQHTIASLTNTSSENLYTLMINTDINGTDYAAMTVNFKNQIAMLQYLETIIQYKGQRVFRSKNGLQTQRTAHKTRFTPIFLLETQLLGGIKLRGSCDVYEDQITFNSITLTAAEDLIVLAGTAGKNTEEKRVNWDLTLGGKYLDASLDGSVDYMDDILIFTTTMTRPDGTTTPPSYRLTLDFQNRTSENNIVAWDGKIEVDLSHKPELSFRLDTDYTLTSTRSFGNFFRLCYNGVDCTNTQEKITLHHDLKYTRNTEANTFNSNFTLTFTHPAKSVSYTLDMDTKCGRDIPSYSHLIVTNRMAPVFNLTVNYIPEMVPSDGSLVVSLDIPGLYSFVSTDIWRIKDASSIYWLTKMSSGEKEMSAALDYTLTVTPETVVPMTYNFSITYIDLNNTVYVLRQDSSIPGPANSERITSILKNNTAIFTYYERDTFVETEEKTHYSSIYVARTTFFPGQDYSYNSTFDLFKADNDAIFQMYVSFMPRQEPISLTVNFDNQTTEEKKEGSLTATLQLPTMNITLNSGGKYENGVPAGNVSIKFCCSKVDSKTYGVGFAVSNDSTALIHNYTTQLFATAPAHQASLQHTMQSDKESVLPLTSTLTVGWNGQESSLNFTTVFDDELFQYNASLLLTIPGHKYLIAFNLPEEFNGFVVRMDKDGTCLIGLDSFLFRETSSTGITHTLDVDFYLKEHLVDLSVTLANLTTSYSLTANIQDNMEEVAYINAEVQLYTGQDRFDYYMQTRSMYLPGYDTNTVITFNKEEVSTELTTTFNVDGTTMISIIFNNGTAEDNENQRRRYLAVSLPTNVNPLFRKLAIEDRCEMSEELLTHNVTLMWGTFLPTQLVELRLKMENKTTTQMVSLGLQNPGSVLGLSSSYDLTMSNIKTGYNRNAVISMTSGLLNKFTFEVDYRNHSQGMMCHHVSTVSLTRPAKAPIRIVSSLVRHDGNTILDTDLTVDYSLDTRERLTAGIQVNRVPSGHSAELTLRQLVNNIDVMIMGTYVNSTDQFQMTLENNILLGGSDRYQPQLACTLNRNTKQIDISYTGSGSYEFHGQFTNRSNEDGRIYQINCRNVYNGRNVPYELLFDEPDRLIAARVNYNPENPEDFWEFNAGYLNETALYVQLDTTHSGQLIQNGSVILNLTPTKVLVTHIMWEPSWPQDIKAKVLDIIQKVNASAQAERVFFSNKLTELRDTMNVTLWRYLMTNADILGQYVMFKTNLAMQLALLQPMRDAQLVDLKLKWNRFNTTVHDTFSQFGQGFLQRGRALEEDFADMRHFYRFQSMSYAQEVNRTWQMFLVCSSHIKMQFDVEAFLRYQNESSAASYAFYDKLLSDYAVQASSIVDPQVSLFRDRFRQINESMIALKEEILREIQTRIESLKMEKITWQAKMVPLMMDIYTFNQTLRQAITTRREFFQQEFQAFQNPNFTPYVEFGQLLNQTVRDTVRMLNLTMIGCGAQFAAPYFALFMQPMHRFRRQAPQVDFQNIRHRTSMQFAQIERALAQLDASYLPTTSQGETTWEDQDVVVESVDSVAVAVPAPVFKSALARIWESVFQLVKLDIENGEIITKIFLKPSNATWFNKTTEIIATLRNSSALQDLDTTVLDFLHELFDVDSLSKYRQRFQEQFETLKSELREMSENAQTQVQQTIQSRIRPYLERLDDITSQRSRPFFGSQMLDANERRSFFTELLEDLDMSSLKQTFGKVQQEMCHAYNKIKSSLAIAKRATCARTWMPPYSASALLVGTKHYMTFDEQFYDFSGKCGYLLAQDFVHENDFSAIVDYEREMDVPFRNMMFIINSTTFEIGSDGSISVGREPRELPLQEGNTVMMRIGESILLMNTEGITIKCNVIYNVCSVRLSGRYFARTGGLLGNFNYEMFDDFKTPDNILMTNITSFTDSWKVGKNCHAPSTESLDRNRVIPSMDAFMNFDPLLEDNQGCASMFLDNCSPLAQCHDLVEPDSFYKMCVIDTHDALEEDVNRKMCSVAQAYRSKCFGSGIKLSMPDTCITCDIGNETFDASEPRRLENENEIPRMVDVVIVVEEKLCAQEMVDDHLDDLVSSLAGELKESGFNNTRFGLVGFGGDGVHDLPHEHTINHKIFNKKSNEFPLGRDSLEFAEDGSNDTFAAIYLAANYPFRAGVAKHIVLVSCSECRDEDTNMQFSDLSVLLNKRGITFTMLTNFDFNIKKETSKSKSKSSIFGIDANAVYTSKAVTLQGALKGDPALREFVNEPNNRCSLLALETNGAIFDSGMVGNKKFEEVFAKRISKNSDPMPCQVCQCVPVRMNGVGRSICEQCPDPLNPLFHDIRGTIRDFELYFKLPHTRFDNAIEEEE